MTAVAVTVDRTAAAQNSHESMTAALTVVGLAAVITLPSSCSGLGITDDGRRGTASPAPPWSEIAEWPAMVVRAAHPFPLAHTEWPTSVVRVTGPLLAAVVVDKGPTTPGSCAYRGKSARKGRRPHRGRRNDKKRSERRREERKRKEKRRRKGGKRREDERRKAGDRREKVDWDGKRLRKNQRFPGNNKIIINIDGHRDAWTNNLQSSPASASSSPPSASSSPPSAPPSPLSARVAVAVAQTAAVPQTDDHERAAGGFTVITASLAFTLSALVAVLCRRLWTSSAVAASVAPNQVPLIPSTVLALAKPEEKMQPVYGIV